MARKPESRERLRLRGSWRGKTGPKAESVSYDNVGVDVPPGLSNDAAAIFIEIQNKMILWNCWDSCFRIPLERYAQVWARWIEVTSRPTIFENDLVKLDKILRDLESKFGLNPADRKNLPKGKQDSEIDSDKMRFFKPTLSR